MSALIKTELLAFARGSLLMRVWSVLLLADLLCILKGAVLPDLILRTTLLGLLVVQGALYMRSSGTRPAAIFLLAGWLVAIANEYVQVRFGTMARTMTGTALYYGLFALALMQLRLVPFARRRFLTAAAALVVYFGTLAYALKIPVFEWASVLYMFGAAGLFAFAFFPYLSAPQSPGTATLALAGAALLLSDSLRAVQVFRLGFWSETFMVAHLIEAAILFLFFCGHGLLLLTLRPR